MVVHQCGCKYVELKHSFFQMPFRSVDTGVVDHRSVVPLAYICWNKAGHNGMVVGYVCCDVS